MTEVFTKIKDNPIFKSDPDKVVRNFILPQYKRTIVEVLDDFIAVKFYSSPARDGTVKTHRHYHYTRGGKLIKVLGDADEITFEGARILLKKLISNSHTNGVAAPKNTLASVFKIYCEYNAFAEKTLRKLQFRFQSRLKCVSDKDIGKITKKEIMQILDPIYKNGKFALLKDLFYFIRSLFRFARDRGISDNLLFCDTQLKNLYKIPKSGGYSYISENADLRLLIKYIMSYPHQIGVKNALIFGLLTGLRSSNVRNLTHAHLKVDDDGEYYLLYPQDENKVKANGDEYLGLPKEVGEWLESIKTKSPLSFVNTEGNVLSEATLAC